MWSHCNNLLIMFIYKRLTWHSNNVHVNRLNRKLLFLKNYNARRYTEVRTLIIIVLLVVVVCLGNMYLQRGAWQSRKTTKSYLFCRILRSCHAPNFRLAKRSSWFMFCVSDVPNGESSRIQRSCGKTNCISPRKINVESEFLPRTVSVWPFESVAMSHASE